MLSSWDKVRSFLETMDVRDVHSPYPFSSTFSSSSSNSDSVGHPSFVGTRSWLVGDETIKQILSVIQPTMDSENRRKEIIEFLQQLIGGALGIKVFVCGSVPLKTYLPHGDVDLTAVSNFGSSQELAADICGLLEYEKQNGAALPVRDVFSVPAQVRVVKCTVGNIAVDISFNQTAGLCALYFLDQVDQFVGKDHLFKLSIILIKAWCYYESRLLGSFYGLISTYGLEIMVLHVINLFHSSLHCPLAVLHKFLEYYSTFDWTLYCVAINGLVLLSSLPKIEVLSSNCDGLLLTEDFLRCTRDPLLPSTGVVGTKNSVFPVKFLNILDPLKDDNNLGRSVNKGNFFRIRSALSYGAEKLREVLMLPPEKIGGGLEKFFKTTLERNGQGKRADVLFPVPVYGSESLKNVNTDLLTGIHYGSFEENWNSRGTASSVDYRGGPQINDDTSVEGMWKSREFYPFIPSYDRPMQEVPIFEDNGKEHEKKKEEESGNLASQSGALIGSNIASDVGESSSLAKYSMDEFPVLPASKPIPIRPSPLACAQGDQVKETSESSDSTEFGSCKLASPTSLSLSEAGKQSDSDGSIFLDALSEPTDAVVIPKDKSPSESQEKMVVPVPALQLTDESEFPPLSRPERPVITLSKKEFPPLRACLRSQKRSKGRR
ncbi:hypothetical protein RND81_10G089100 [Saponaria officinalis]|uniref:Polymerase nucleotidyl transferase domain-containing protein n=1 Tax=Saponaria officinalis TaxID=3572 RepID=A0AAW1I2K3_SAPOF